jgi:uracil-DNA glycosylase
MTMSRKSLPTLLDEARACRICEAHLEPRPVLQAGHKARILIIGQAPGAKVHASGIPWDDVSGRRLRSWLGVDVDTFYDPTRVALLPMGFCFPGSAATGDLPPRPECAPQWHPPLLAAMPSVQLTLLLGLYAQGHYLEREGTLTDHAKRWRTDLRRGRVALPHPSPRSRWTHQNPWFETDVLPALRRKVKRALA